MITFRKDLTALTNLDLLNLVKELKIKDFHTLHNILLNK